MVYLASLSMTNLINVCSSRKLNQTGMGVCSYAYVMGRHSWLELKAPLTHTEKKKANGPKRDENTAVEGATLKIPGRPAISGVCAEQLLRSRALSVSNYCSVCVCVCVCVCVLI